MSSLQQQYEQARNHLLQTEYQPFKTPAELREAIVNWLSGARFKNKLEKPQHKHLHMTIIRQLQQWMQKYKIPPECMLTSSVASSKQKKQLQRMPKPDEYDQHEPFAAPSLHIIPPVLQQKYQDPNQVQEIQRKLEQKRLLKLQQQQQQQRLISTESRSIVQEELNKQDDKQISVQILSSNDPELSVPLSAHQQYNPPIAFTNLFSPQTSSSYSLWSNNCISLSDKPPVYNPSAKSVVEITDKVIVQQEQPIHQVIVNDSLEQFLHDCFTNEAEYEEYLQVFKCEEIDMSILSEITDDVLKQMGINKVGIRLKIRKTINHYTQHLK